MRTYLVAGLMLSLIGSAYAQTTVSPMTGTTGAPSGAPMAAPAAPMTPAQTLRSRLQSAVPSNQPSSTTGQTPGPGATTTPAAPGIAAPAQPAAAGTAATPRHRRTQQERFDEANITHDGHLTLAQAQASPPHGWNMVVKNFAVIDSTHKGYVTMDDLHAYRSQKSKAARAAKMAH